MVNKVHIDRKDTLWRWNSFMEEQKKEEDNFREKMGKVMAWIKQG